VKNYEMEKWTIENIGKLSGKGATVILASRNAQKGEEAKIEVLQLDLMDLESIAGSQYYGPHRNMTGYPIVVKSNKDSHNREDARKLWEMSEQLASLMLHSKQLRYYCLQAMLSLHHPVED